MNNEILVKFGARDHLQRLLDNGEVYMNTLRYFREMEHDLERRDPYEGRERVMSMNGTKIYIKDVKSGKNKLMATGTSGLALHKNSNLDRFNIYSLFYFKTQESTEIEIDKLINYRMKERLGDSALIIYNPKLFVVMIKEMILKSGFKHWRKQVEYVDIKNLNGEVGPFIKDASFSHQQELRIAAFNADREYGPVTFNIGSLKNIACLVDVKDLPDIKLCYQ